MWASHLGDADGLIIVIEDLAKAHEEAPQQVPQVLVHLLPRVLLLRWGLAREMVALRHEVGYGHVREAEAGDAAGVDLMQPVALHPAEGVPRT